MKLPDFDAFNPFNKNREDMKAKLPDKALPVKDIQRLSVSDLKEAQKENPSPAGEKKNPAKPAIAPKTGVQTRIKEIPVYTNKHMDKALHKIKRLQIIIIIWLAISSVAIYYFSNGVKNITIIQEAPVQQNPFRSRIDKSQPQPYHLVPGKPNTLPPGQK